MSDWLETPNLLAQTFVRTVDWRDVIDSTNQRAATADIPDSQLPCLIGAETQTLGRGRGKNQWWSCSGSLTFSLLFDPTAHGLSQSHWPLLSLATACALSDAIESVAGELRCQVKWPNDVYVEDRKVAGILLESSQVNPSRLVVGIGLNVNNSFRDAPLDLKESATSLSDQLGRELPRFAVLRSILQHLDQACAAIATGEFGQRQPWAERCLLTGELVSVQLPDREVTGLCSGVDEDGALRLQTAHGPERFLSGTVRRLR